MYNYIKGEICKLGDGRLVIEASGIGYDILASADCYEQCTDKVFTYLSIKEDSHTLFGFASGEEKALFLQLLGVSGVGPKSALNLLSSGHKYISNAISTGNINIKGVSKKTADKVILELSGKVVGEVSENNEVNDAVAALVNLGLPRNVAIEKVKLVNTGGLDTEAIIRAVLSK